MTTAGPGLTTAARTIQPATIPETTMAAGLVPATTPGPATRPAHRAPRARPARPAPRTFRARAAPRARVMTAAPDPAAARDHPDQTLQAMGPRARGRPGATLRPPARAALARRARVRTI